MLPTKKDILTMDYSKDGGPWVKTTANDAIDTTTMDYSKDGSPWVVAKASMKKIIDVLRSWGMRPYQR